MLLRVRSNHSTSCPTSADKEHTAASQGGRLIRTAVKCYACKKKKKLTVTWAGEGDGGMKNTTGRAGRPRAGYLGGGGGGVGDSSDSCRVA